MAKDLKINRRLDRVEEIIETLEADEVSPEKGEELHEEAKELVNKIREQLHEGEGAILEIE